MQDWPTLFRDLSLVPTASLRVTPTIDLNLSSLHENFDATSKRNIEYKIPVVQLFTDF